MTNVTLFSQIISKIDRNIFYRVVRKHHSDKYNKGINSWNHLVSMLFCQFAKAESLRDISNGLRSATGNLNHLGLSRAASKSSLSYINAHRSSELFRDLYFELLNDFHVKTGISLKKFKIKDRHILLLDSSTVSLCLSLFNWAHYRTTKGAVKLHTLLDYDGCIPLYVHISDGKTGDNTAAKWMDIPSGSVVVADRYYCDFDLLNIWDSRKDNISYVVRHKGNLNYTMIEEFELPPDTDQDILIDGKIILNTPSVIKKYPQTLRHIAVYNAEKNETINLLTNNLFWTARQIADLYQARWHIESFFKDIKQLLKIKSFVGTSENAVKIQIWVALITIMILKYLKYLAKYDWHLSNLVGFIRLNLFVKINLQQWLDKPFEDDVGIKNSNQMGIQFEKHHTSSITH